MIKFQSDEEWINRVLTDFNNEVKTKVQKILLDDEAHKIIRRFLRLS